MIHASRKILAILLICWVANLAIADQLVVKHVQRRDGSTTEASSVTETSTQSEQLQLALPTINLLLIVRPLSECLGLSLIFAATLTPHQLPITPVVTPGFGVAGAILMLTGLVPKAQTCGFCLEDGDFANTLIAWCIRLQESRRTGFRYISQRHILLVQRLRYLSSM